MFSVRKLSPAEFFARTVGGTPSGSRALLLSRHAFACACGRTHGRASRLVPVLRALPGRRLVLACPDGLPFVTCVRRRGLLRLRGFDSLFGAELIGPEVLRPYETLGVGPEVRESDLRAAYRDLVRVWHPDRFEGDARLRRKAEEKLKEINLAYAEVRQRLADQRFRAACYPPPSTEPRQRAGPVSMHVPLSKFRPYPG